MNRARQKSAVDEAMPSSGRRNGDARRPAGFHEPDALAFRLLQRLAEPGVEAERVPEAIQLVRHKRAGIEMIGTHPRESLAPLVESGAVTCRMVAGKPRFVISEAGRAALFRRQEVLRGGLAPEDAFAEQHRLSGNRAPNAVGAHTSAVPRVNLRESPLALLARQREGFARDFIGPAAVEAGERLARDMAAAMIEPRMGVDFGRVTVDGGASLGQLTLPERAMAARERVRRALSAVGPDHAGLLTDVCGFSLGLEQIEAARCLPARSAKLWLGLALRALARHYGLADEARGKTRQQIRVARD